MEPAQLQQADFLDIVFEGRNKEYGAYELRRHYNRRMLLGMIVMISFTSMVCASYLLTHRNGEQKQVMMVKDIVLQTVAEEKKAEPVTPPPPPPPAQRVKMEITRFTPPRIVKDNEVKDEDRPPVQEKLEETKIGTINQEGEKDAGVVAPPVSDGGRGVVEAPKAHQDEIDYDKTFVKVEIESEYPGGPGAWLRYLNKHFHYPEEGLAAEIQGTVMVQFIVDKDGNVSNVEAISGPEEGGLRQEAVRVIKRSGLWIPAIQNGRKVKSYKKQPVIFKISMG